MFELQINGARRAVRTAFMAGWNQGGATAYQGCQICAPLRKTYIPIPALSSMRAVSYTAPLPTSFFVAPPATVTRGDQEINKRVTGDS